MAKKHHPDAVGDCPKNEEKFKRITAAYEVLSNDDTRKQYDSARISAAQQTAGEYTRDPFQQGSQFGGRQGGFSQQKNRQDDWANFNRQYNKQERTYTFHGKNGSGFAGYRGHGQQSYDQWKKSQKEDGNYNYYYQDMRDRKGQTYSTGYQQRQRH